MSKVCRHVSGAIADLPEPFICAEIHDPLFAVDAPLPGLVDNVANFE
jgi:hypothetical protein